MAWMNLSPLTPVALTTPHFLRWCSGSRWITGSTTPSAPWWVPGGTNGMNVLSGYFAFNTAVVWLVWFVQGWFSPGQVFVLDEYCARNGVRGCHRHLCYLRDLLERAERGAIIDPTLLHYSFAFCASHVHGNRCVLISTLTLFWTGLESIFSYLSLTNRKLVFFRPVWEYVGIMNTEKNSQG